MKFCHSNLVQTSQPKHVLSKDLLGIERQIPVLCSKRPALRKTQHGMSLSQTLQHCSWSPWKSACVQVLQGSWMCRMLSSGQSLIPKELKVAVKIWCLAMSWNDASGGGCNEPNRAADFNGLTGNFPPAALSLLHCRAIALNFPRRLVHAILQQVSRGCVQSLRETLGLEKGSQAGREGMGKQVLYSYSPHTPRI